MLVYLLPISSAQSQMNFIYKMKENMHGLYNLFAHQMKQFLRIWLRICHACHLAHYLNERHRYEAIFNLPPKYSSILVYKITYAYAIYLLFSVDVEQAQGLFKLCNKRRVKETYKSKVCRPTTIQHAITLTIKCRAQATPNICSTR